MIIKGIKSTQTTGGIMEENTEYNDERNHVMDRNKGMNEYVPETYELASMVAITNPEKTLNYIKTGNAIWRTFQDSFWFIEVGQPKFLKRIVESQPENTRWYNNEYIGQITGFLNKAVAGHKVSCDPCRDEFYNRLLDNMKEFSDHIAPKEL